MRDIYVVYRAVGQIMLAYGTDVYDSKNRETFSAIDDLVTYFNRSPKGIKLRDRKNLHVIVNVESPLIQDAVVSDLEGKINSVRWAKAHVVYRFSDRPNRVYDIVGGKVVSPGSSSAPSGETSSASSDSS